MKLSEYAKKLGIKYQTAFKHYNLGIIKNAYQLETGTIIVPDASIQAKPEYTIIYARVSSNDRKDQMDSQAERLKSFCIAKGWVVNEIVKEVASGMNDNRPKLQRIFQERLATRLVVEHKDRLTRFGFGYIKTLFNDCEIIVVNEAETAKDDLMSDFVSVVTCFCARIYGLRKGRRKSSKIIEELEK